MKQVLAFGLVMGLVACGGGSDAPEPGEVRLLSVNPQGTITYQATCGVEGVDCQEHVIAYCAEEFGNNPQVMAHRLKNNVLISIDFRCSGERANLLPRNILYIRTE